MSSLRSFVTSPTAGGLDPSAPLAGLSVGDNATIFKWCLSERVPPGDLMTMLDCDLCQVPVFYPLNNTDFFQLRDNLRDEQFKKVNMTDAEYDRLDAYKDHLIQILRQSSLENPNDQHREDVLQEFRRSPAYKIIYDPAIQQDGALADNIRQLEAIGHQGEARKAKLGCKQRASQSASKPSASKSASKSGSAAVRPSTTIKLFAVSALVTLLAAALPQV